VSEIEERDFDQLLKDLEATIVVLAEGSAPLEELVTAHHRALDLLAQATKRLNVLSAEVDAATRSLGE
jgi:exonuclease VII small subunit